jgi:hypothetical protein
MPFYYALVVFVVPHISSHLKAPPVVPAPMVDRHPLCRQCPVWCPFAMFSEEKKKLAKKYGLSKTQPTGSLPRTSATTDVVAGALALVAVPTGGPPGLVQMLTGAAGPGAAVVVAERHLAPAGARGIWGGFAGRETCASPNIAGFRVDVRPAAVVHDGVCVATGEFPEELYAHGEQLSAEEVSCKVPGRYVLDKVGGCNYCCRVLLTRPLTFPCAAEVPAVWSLRVPCARPRKAAS